MRFNNFNLSPSPEPTTTTTTTTEEIQWVPLQTHPIFTTKASTASSYSPTHTNLIAWDGASCLYFWDTHNHCLHRLSIRFEEPQIGSIFASSSSKVMRSEIPVKFEVNHISINSKRSAMILSGSDGLCVMHLYGKTSATDNAIICRTGLIGSGIYFADQNPIRTLQTSWHPSSDIHLGILSSDSVFRLFDLSSDAEKPEQEYYLQPVEPGKCSNPASICPVSFSFGGKHLWDRFTVFLLFSDGSIYILCPVVPFGCIYGCESIWEIYNDAQAFGMESSNSIAVSNSCLAIAWLESTFPELAHQAAEGDSFLALKAHPYVPFDASLSLQGPLRQVCHSDHDSEAPVAECQGKAVGLLYNLISKDSILVTAWSSGNLQIDALVDEIQPVWDVGSSPRLCVDSHDNIHRLAMICETNFDKLTIVKLDQPLDHTVWLGHPPPLLRLAVVDLALPANKDNGSCLFSMFVDSLKPERIFCLHNDGIDSIFLHFLPFTYQSRGKNEIMKAPSVNPVLSTCQGNLDFASPLCGFMALADSFGHSWIVGITSSQECIVLEMQGSDVSMPLVERTKKYHNFENLADINTPDIISKELLSEPKVVLAPQASPNMRAVTADSIEGRSTLHQYFNLFHENYVEYAHKIWFELKHHGTYLKRTVDDQNARLRESQIRIRNVEEKQPSLEERITRAVQVHTHLEERLQKLRNLPNAHKKPLSRAEREFKSEIDRFTGVELDALHSSIGVLHARLRKHSQSPQSNSPRQAQGRKKTHVADSQISYLRSAIEKLSLVNSENSKKAKLVESALSNKESS